VTDSQSPTGLVNTGGQCWLRQGPLAALLGGSNRTRADQFAAPLGPDAVAADVDSRRPGAAATAGVEVFVGPAHDRGVAAAERATKPWAAFPMAPVPTSLLPCWVRTPALRV
jgi:hypothetical protein